MRLYAYAYFSTEEVYKFVGHAIRTFRNAHKHMQPLNANSVSNKRTRSAFIVTGLCTCGSQETA